MQTRKLRVGRTDTMHLFQKMLPDEILLARFEAQKHFLLAIFSHDKEESAINNQSKVKICFRIQMQNDFKHFSLLHV